MGYTPYDWNESVQHRISYVDRRLRQGSPVVGLAFERGMLLLSVRKTQRKVFEVFDHILFAGMGSQSDVEAIRIHSINFASEEGFNRSPDDVSVQRLVAGLSPILKKAFSDVFNAPFIFRGIYAEMGRTPDRDQFTTLNYDGEYSVLRGSAVIGATPEAEKRMNDVLTRGVEPLRGAEPASSDVVAPTLEAALRTAIEAWSEGFAATLKHTGFSKRDDDDEPEEKTSPHQALEEALKEGAIEAGVLERQGKNIRFRLLTQAELDRARV